MAFLDGGLYGNLCATLIILVYIKFGISVCDYAVTNGFLAPDVSRKLVHLTASSVMVWWPLYDEAHWSWILNIMIPTIFMIQLFVKGAIIQDPHDEDVRSMSRSGNPVELLYGPLFFTIILNITGIFFFMKPEAVYIMAAVGYGDGIAPLVGQRFPIETYRCPGGIKSIGGSITVFFSTIAGFFLLQYAVGIPEEVNWKNLLLVAGTATAVEGASPGDFDNIAIFGAVSLVLMLRNSS